MLVAALFGHDGVPQDVRDLALHGAAVEIGEVDAAFGEHGDVAIGQKKHVAGVAEHGRYVRSHEILTVA